MSEPIEHIYNRMVAEEKLKAGTKYERLAALVFQILDRAWFVIHDVELRGPARRRNTRSTSPPAIDPDSASA